MSYPSPKPFYGPVLPVAQTVGPQKSFASTIKSIFSNITNGGSMSSSYSRVRKNEESQFGQTEYLSGRERELFIQPFKRDEYESLSIDGFGMKHFKAELGYLRKLDKVLNEGVRKEERAVIAGGSMVHQLAGCKWTCDDIDIFFHSFAGFKRAIERLGLNGYTFDYEQVGHVLSSPAEVKFLEGFPASPVHNSPDGRKVQLIKMVWQESAAEIISCFDLSIVKFALEDGTITYSKRGLRDYLERRITISGSMFPVSLVRRIKKYNDRGFSMEDGTIADMIDELTGFGRDYKLNMGVRNVTQPMAVEPLDTHWNDPEFQRDYMEMDPESLRKKWGNV